MSNFLAKAEMVDLSLKCSAVHEAHRLHVFFPFVCATAIDASAYRHEPLYMANSFIKAMRGHNYAYQ